MVFIAIGAFKAAKAAKREYDKDKKRSQIITSLHNSRSEFDNAPPSSSPDFWSSDEPSESEPQRPHVSEHAFGAWSRDQLMEQMTEEQSRQEEHDTRFREQLSGSSVSLSPSHILAPTNSELDQTPSHDDGAQQMLPPAVSEPSTERETDSEEASAPHANAKASSSRVPRAKPPRPTKPPASVEGSYEAMLKASSARIQQSRQRANSASEVSSAGVRSQELLRNDDNSQMRTASRPRKALDGSFESALRNGTLRARNVPKPTLSAAEHANQQRAQTASAVPSFGQAKRQVKRDFTPAHAISATTPPAENSNSAQNPDKSAEQSSAFANTTTTKRVMKRPPGASRSPNGVNSVSSEARSAAGECNNAQSPQGSAFQQEGLCAKTRRPSRNASTTGAAPRTTLALGNAAQANLTGSSSNASANSRRSDVPAGASCMSAEGTMKKKRGRQHS